MWRALVDYLKTIRLEGWLGIWGAVLGTWGALLATLIAVRDARKRPRVKVGVHVGGLPGAPGPVLLLNMVAGDLAAKVIHVGIRRARGVFVYPGHPDILEIKPHQAGTATWLLAQLRAQAEPPGSLEGALRAFATLADGRTFLSRRFRLADAGGN